MGYIILQSEWESLRILYKPFPNPYKSFTNPFRILTNPLQTLSEPLRILYKPFPNPYESFTNPLQTLDKIGGFGPLCREICYDDDYIDDRDNLGDDVTKDYVNDEH